jgi:amino acid transporter
MAIIEFLLGRRLANREHNERKIGAFEGVPAMGLDGLASSAYGPEAALTVLMVLGAGSLAYVGWVMGPILVLLAVLFVSYWQTIRAYPSSGGAYLVAKENLGTNASLLAAAALMVDYVLNVAVGISAGVAALVSAVPALHGHILPLCLAILALVTVVNLRGTLDAGRIFAIPTYTFVASFAVILVLGIYRSVGSDGHPDPVVAPPPLVPAAGAAVSLWLLLRAFASGCTAMTGVEAVSDGMSAFREPSVRHGHRTLAAIVLILGTLLAGISYLATTYGIGAMHQMEAGYQSVLSQLAKAVVGDGLFYYIAIGSLLCVLALSANTSLVDFPRLCRTVAQDGFLPKPFAVAGRRLVFSAGILYLSVCAALLLVVFGGITEHLIPLFAIGAFLTFTVSQTGMVVHWRRALRTRPGEAGASRVRLHLWINAAGAIATGCALVVILFAKFTEGAWITVVVIPAVIVLLRWVARYYRRVSDRVRDRGPLDLSNLSPPVVIVAIDNWNKLADKAMTFALSLSPTVVAVHLVQLSGPEGDDHVETLRSKWRDDVEQPASEAGIPAPRLVVLQAQYRAIHEPLIKLIAELEIEFEGRLVAVLIPELVKVRWYQHLLHTHRARQLRSRLLRSGGTSVTVVNVPWHLGEKALQAPSSRASEPHGRGRAEATAASL